jgi:hypothetical protein
MGFPLLVMTISCSVGSSFHICAGEVTEKHGPAGSADYEWNGRGELKDVPLYTSPCSRQE